MVALLKRFRQALAGAEAPPSDEDLMLAYAAGSQTAFRTLYERHRTWLYRVVLHQCHHEAQAADIFQEAWLTLVRHAPSYQPTAQFTTWLYLLARQRLVDAWRVQQREKPEISASSFNEDDDEIDDERFSDERFAPEPMAQRRELAGHLLAALATLPAEQREAFLLAEESGMTVEQIATATGATLEGAKSRLRYARARLKRHLIEHYGERP